MKGKLQEISTPAQFRPGWSYNVLPETRPLGLKGDLIADRWEFASGRRHKPLTMAWTRVVANGLSLNDPVNAKFWELSRRFFTACRNGQATGKPMAVSTCIGATYLLFRIIDEVVRSGATCLWTFKRQGFDSLLIALTRRDASKNESDFVRGTVRARFEVVRLLYALLAEGSASGVVLNDGFSFVTFSSSEEVVALAKLIGQEQATTPDAPPEVVFPLLNAAIEYVAYYSDDIIGLHLTVERLRSELEEKLRAHYRPRYTRRAEIASALVGALIKRPSWVDGSNAVLKTELARHLGMASTDTYKKCYRPLFQAAEFLFVGGKGKLADEARSFLMSEATKSSAAKRDPAVGPHLARAIGLPFSGEAGEHAPWPIMHVGNSKGAHMGLGTAVNRLWTASYLILASFMADRESETLAIEADCLVYGVDGCYIKTPNFKSRNVDGGSLVLQPCPKAVELAVLVLQRLGQAARAKANSNKLLCVSHHMGSSVPDVTELRKRIVLFAEATKTNVYRGKKWHLTPHQLRRFFVTTWINYYEFGRYFKALSTVLDHASLATTIRYGTRVAQAAALSKGQKNLANRILTGVALGDVFGKGPVAQNLARFVELLRVRAVPLDQISELVVERNYRNDVELSPMPHGYCVWSKTAGQHAACVEKSERKAGISRPRSRKRSCVCGNGCRNFLMTEAFGAFWEHALERHHRIARNPAAPTRYREASKIGMRIAKSYGPNPPSKGAAR